MTDYTVILPGGLGGVALATGGGKYYRVLSASSPVDVSVNGGFPLARAQGEQQHVPGGIQSLRLSSAAAQTVVVTVTEGGLDDGRVTQTAPVELAQATTVTDNAPVAMLVVPWPLIAPAASGVHRAGLRFWNQGSADVMIGGGAVTLTSGIPIPPGGVWVEETGADAGWHGITAAAGTNSVAVQVLT